MFFYETFSLPRTYKEMSLGGIGMTGTHFLILILIAAAFSTSFYIFASKRGIPKPRWWYKPVNSIQGVLEIVLLILLGFSLLRFPPEYMLILYLFVINCLRALMEWKYEREEKQYVHSLFGAALFLVIFIYMSMFFFVS